MLLLLIKKILGVVYYFIYNIDRCYIFNYNGKSNCFVPITHKMLTKYLINLKYKVDIPIKNIWYRLTYHLKQSRLNLRTNTKDLSYTNKFCFRVLVFEFKFSKCVLFDN